MKKSLMFVVIVVLFIAMIPMGAFSEQVNDGCKMCNYSGILTCSEDECPEGNFCMNCLKRSWSGYSVWCSTCGGSGKQSIMGQKVPCSGCLGTGEGKADYDRCETCGGHLVCHKCMGAKDIPCYYCAQKEYEVFVYNQVMRKPNESLGKAFIVEGDIVETSDVGSGVTKLIVSYAVNNKTDIEICVFFNPKKFGTEKILIGDSVKLYAKLMYADEKNSDIPTFYSVYAEIDGVETAMQSDDSLESDNWLKYLLKYMPEYTGIEVDTSSVEAFCKSLPSEIPLNPTGLDELINKCDDADEFVEVFFMMYEAGDGRLFVFSD